MTHDEMIAQIEHNKNDISSLKHRVKDCEEAQTNFSKLLRTVDKLAINMEYMFKEQQKQGERLEKLEHEPAEEFKHYKRVIIGCVITGVLGTLLGALLAIIIKGV